MIPKSIIEKAIEGGWKPAPSWLLPDDGGIWVNTLSGTIDRHLGWKEIALDPTFWQALGKALGWEVKYREQVVGIEHASDGLSIEVKTARSENEVWFDTAHRFYDLILTGGHIADGRTCLSVNGSPCKCVEKFWADLLK